MEAFLASDMDLTEAGKDTLFRLLSEIKVLNYNQAIDRLSGDKPIGGLARQYTHEIISYHALFCWFFCTFVAAKKKQY